MGGIAARGQIYIYMGVPIGVVEIHLRSKRNVREVFAPPLTIACHFSAILLTIQ